MSAKITDRIWLDTIVLENTDKAKALELISSLPKDGKCQFVIANTIVDVRVFLNNLSWVEEAIKRKHILIEVWLTPDEMTSKDFFWSVFQTTTPASGSFAEAIKHLHLPPSYEDRLLTLKGFVEEYGIPKGEWEQGTYSAPKELSPEAAAILGIAPTKNRTKVLLACKRQNRMDIFDDFNVGYNEGLAHQHLCNKMLLIDGSIREI